MFTQDQLTFNENQRAQLALDILQSLEDNTATIDWVEELQKAKIGTYGECWLVSRYLGAKACQIRHANKSITFIVSSRFLARKGLDPHSSRPIKMKFPLDGINYGEADGDILDCLETAAIISYAQGFKKAMRICVEEMNKQIALTGNGEWTRNAKQELAFYAQWRQNGSL